MSFVLGAETEGVIPRQRDRCWDSNQAPVSEERVGCEQKYLRPAVGRQESLSPATTVGGRVAWGNTHGRSLSRALFGKSGTGPMLISWVLLGCVLFIESLISEVVYFSSTLFSFKTSLFLGEKGEGREKPGKPGWV